MDQHILYRALVEVLRILETNTAWDAQDQAIGYIRGALMVYDSYRTVGGVPGADNPLLARLLIEVKEA